MPGRLRPLFARTEAPIKSPLFITIPGIGTPSIEQWRQGITGPLWFQELSKDGLCYTWEHGLSANSNLSWQAICNSAIELLDHIIGLRRSLGRSFGPVVFLAHSLGGSILKQTICLGSNNDTENIADNVAAIVLIGCPHPKHLDDASQLCNRFKQAFVDKSFHLKAFPDGDAANMVTLSSKFDNLRNTFSLLTVYENQGTRLSWRKSKKLRIVHPALAFVDGDQRLPLDCSHRELCFIPINSPVHRSICNFAREHALRRRAALDEVSLRRANSFSPSLSYTIGTWDDSESGNNDITSSDSSGAVTGSGNTAHTPDLSFQNLKVKLPYYHQIPTPNPDFFARDEISSALYENLLSWRQNEESEGIIRRGVRTFALCGDVGSGKTQIASQFVHNHQDHYDVILWLHAKEVTKLWTSYDEIATALGLQASDSVHDTIASRDLVKDWLARSSNSFAGESQAARRVKWLLVFDNVDDPDILMDFWPEGGAGDVLITSRHPLTKTANFFGQMGVDVEPFNTDLAVKFLSQLTQRGLDDHQTLAAAQIAETLGGLPLGLVSASRLINEGFLTLSEHGFDGIQYRNSASMQTEEPRSGLSGPTGNAYDQVQSMILVLLEKLTTGGSALMDILALLDPDGVKESILIHGARHFYLHGFPKNSSSWHVAKAELLKASLISQNQTGDELYIHRWIQDIAKIRMGLARLTEVYEAAIAMFSSLWPRVPIVKRHNVSRWDDYATLLPHVLRLHHFHEGNVQLDLSPRSSIQFAELMNEAAWSLYERGDYDNAFSLSFQARAIGEVQMEDESSKDDVDLINLLSKIYFTLGALCNVTNDRNEGFKANERFLQLRQRLQPKLQHDDELLAQAFNELANGYMGQNNYDNAEIHYRLSIKTYKNLKQPNKLQLSLPAANLGLVLWLKGDLEAASSIVEEALRDREEVLGQDDKESMKTGRLLYAMGNIRSSQGKDEESLYYHRRAYHQLRATNGASHHRTCDASCRLADHYTRLHQPEDAIYHLDQALKVFLYRPCFKNEKARTSFQKGMLLRSLGRSSEAKPYLRTAEAIYRELCPNSTKRRDEFMMKDFDDLVMFWSR